MHADLVIAVRQLLERYGIIEIFGISWVDSERKSVAEIPPALKIFLCDLI